ncbi:hypothetical protein QE152_g22619 [Popillia japonica]|uniref:Uncharacterized protein n=1 Tax=Popillia japonica TaxID=7064 RepID=A0AAW1KKA4_POPJA
MEEINTEKPKTTGEPSDKKTPRPSRAEEDSVSQDTDTAGISEADQQATKGSGKTTNPTDPDAVMRRVATGMIRLTLAKTRISGAQKRKRAILAAIATGKNFRGSETEKGNPSCDRHWERYQTQKKTVRPRFQGTTGRSNEEPVEDFQAI